MDKRITQLDGVRVCAISAVFLQHAFKLKMLWMGVDLFFILSGFLITGILIKNKNATVGTYFGQFYARRARRILPPYILFLFFASIVLGVAWTRHDSIIHRPQRLLRKHRALNQLAGPASAL
jgi:peptidoglycan/LPS O-acetylase OafA/YrhL